MHRERGSATVLASFLVYSVVVLAPLAGWWAAAVSVRHRAGSAADLAALAAAQAWVNGQEPCPAARRLALANDAALVRCRVGATSAQVEVEAVTSLSFFGRDWVLRSRRPAWAGPVTPSPGAALPGPPRREAR